MVIDVDFYDEDEKQFFQTNYQHEYQLFLNAGNKINIPIEDFKTYFLFRHQFEGQKEIYAKFSQELFRKWPYFEDYFEYDDTNEKFISTRSAEGNTEIPESLGVAGALTVASKVLLGATQADWRKIPVLRTKDFDFKHLAACNGKYIEVEAKGCITDNNTLKSSSISNHRRSIKDKKADSSFKEKYNTATDCFFGVITCADNINNLKAYIVDPPAATVNIDPIKYRVLARLYYYHDFIHFISNRSYVSIVLANRLRDLEKIDGIDKLNRQPLINSSFKKLDISESFINTRSSATIGDNIYLGKCEMEGISLFNDSFKVAFIGIHIHIYSILIDQNFDNILSYKHLASTEHDTKVRCRIREDKSNPTVKNAFNSLNISAREGYYDFLATSTLTIASSGLIYGIITSDQILPN